MASDEDDRTVLDLTPAEWESTEAEYAALADVLMVCVGWLPYDDDNIYDLEGRYRFTVWNACFLAQASAPPLQVPPVPPAPPVPPVGLTLIDAL